MPRQLSIKFFRSVLRYTLGGGLSIIGLIAIILLIFNVAYADRVLPRVYLGTWPIGGLSKQKLGQQINQLADQLKKSPIQLTIGAEKITISTDEIGLDIDQKKIVSESLAIGHRVNLLDSLVEQAQLLITPKNVNHSITFDQEALRQLLAQSLQRFEWSPVDAKLAFEDNRLIVKPDDAGQSIDQQLVFEKVKRLILSANFDQPLQITTQIKPASITTELLSDGVESIKQKIGEPIILTWQNKEFRYEIPELISWLNLDAKGSKLIINSNQEVIVKTIESLAKKINRSAKDARLKLQDQKVEIFQPSSTGYELDKDQTLESIISLLAGKSQRTVALVVSEKQPTVTTAQVNDLGINELIGRATTSFAGSPDNRRHNIKNGVQILNGLLVPPDAEFSTIASLGQIDDISGFLPELVIKENRTIPEFGGGLCQVSTTLFRAVLNAGLPVTERRNHSWRITYYERGVGPGLDATVYSPAPDLKFKNDTPGWALIQGFVKGDELTFEIYGTKDDRKVVLDGPKTLSSTKPPAPIYIETSDLPQGETKQIEKSHPGGSAIATYVVLSSDGSQRHRQVFRSSYKAVPAKFLVGIGPAPAPAPESTAEPAPIAPDPTVEATSQPTTPSVDTAEAEATTTQPTNNTPPSENPTPTQ